MPGVEEIMDTKAPSRTERVAMRKASQDANLFGRLSAAAIASRGQAQRLLKGGSRLSITEWRILWDLAEAGPLSIQDMASIQRTDHSLISRAVPEMQRKGYVSTARGTDDKRQSLVALTEEGARAYAEAAPIMADRRARLAEAFTPAELEMFLHYIDRFEACIAAPDDTPTP
jgi:DNA-binding MarR family transcriptional regulator